MIFPALDLVELRRNSIALVEIDKITIEPFFESCQPENLWELWEALLAIIHETRC